MIYTYNNVSKENVIDYLSTIAKSESIINQSPLIESDMQVAINDFSRTAEWLRGTGHPYYVAIRERGVEDGTKEYVKSRCQRLGRPHVIIKVMYNYEYDSFDLAVRK